MKPSKSSITTSSRSGSSTAWSRNAGTQRSVSGRHDAEGAETDAGDLEHIAFSCSVGLEDGSVASTNRMPTMPVARFAVLPARCRGSRSSVAPAIDWALMSPMFSRARPRPIQLLAQVMQAIPASTVTVSRRRIVGDDVAVAGQVDHHAIGAGDRRERVSGANDLDPEVLLAGLLDQRGQLVLARRMRDRGRELHDWRPAQFVHLVEAPRALPPRGTLGRRPPLIEGSRLRGVQVAARGQVRRGALARARTSKTAAASRPGGMAVAGGGLAGRSSCC